MSTAHSLQAHDVELAYGERTIASNLSVSITPGKITSIIGPNGCGKSTLLKALARLLKPTSGTVTLNGIALSEWNSKKLAHNLGLLPQTPLAPEGISVTDLVGRGRTPYQGMLGRWSSRDYDAVAHAINVTGISDLAERTIDELSGGQRQRVWIAMALAQETEVLLLDEPTTYLDVTHQLDVLDLLKDLNTTSATTIVMVLHDLNLAAHYSDELIAMREGKIICTGTPEEVVTEENVHEIFHLTSKVIADPVSGSPMVIPIGRW
ncbi:ABC-type cobalamin/Fe3+-siderophore transport system, ATPase component [Corynebacterium kutscheri]|uniref:ABC-type cobalamin/Fe3+-siderophore transport system, ATPase component n=1 Tax=Corynebacterium kutscheri TaxID=35755 RepID=A0A0F6TE83_9CORY|nr:ABC transporter ATP-binding protein [Corynebacterium kutscheri]AKE42256.1 ABC-type cobalamin/Fe3+-siderophore transport system, ATPase component [Corynebacterium kutscheri]VEH10599.1 iron ABC transporter ATP-binding protein [Corynebacterium kutscheri]